MSEFFNSESSIQIHGLILPRQLFSISRSSSDNSPSCARSTIALQSAFTARRRSAAEAALVWGRAGGATTTGAGIEGLICGFETGVSAGVWIATCGCGATGFTGSAIPGVALAIPGVAAAIPGVVITTPGVAIGPVI